MSKSTKGEGQTQTSSERCFLSPPAFGGEDLATFRSAGRRGTLGLSHIPSILTYTNYADRHAYIINTSLRGIIEWLYRVSIQCKIRLLVNN